MTLAAVVALAVVAVVFVLLASTRASADALFVAALALLLAVPLPDGAGGFGFGVVPLEQAVQGFANPGMLAIAALFVVAAGLRDTGAIDWLAGLLLGRPRSERQALVRVMAPVMALSAFLNNTPLVAMMIPAVQDWAKRIGVSPSRLLLPLSYAAILGGMCSLIGTSTNLVVAGLVVRHGLPPLGMFDLTWVGLPTALVCGAALWWFGPRLLPQRATGNEALADPRQYTLELLVPNGSALVGRSVDSAGLRALPGCFLIELERGDQILAPVGPEQVLHAGDRLLFAGVVDAIRDLVRTRGLAIATDQVFKLDAPRYRRRLFEAVVAPNAHLAGSSIRAAGFRNRHLGAVIAVARNGERLRGRLGDIRLAGGDLLLVEADPGFERRAAASGDFLLVRSLDDSTPRAHHRAPIALTILALTIVLIATGVYPLLVAALLAAVAMVVTRCCTTSAARRSIDWPVLIVIGASLGVGRALEHSGAAASLAGAVLSLSGGSPWTLLAAVYAVTAVATALISNAAAVALTFPIAAAAAQALGVDVLPFAVAVAMGGSASFATPVGYQTNLMVVGPGAYTFGDFLRVGLPINALAAVVTIGLTPLAFPFDGG